MNMRYFWTIDLRNGQVIKMQWLPGADMIADYVTKHHTPVHARNMRNFYAQTKNTATFLTVTPAPQIL